jgi:hypothetical protein
MHIDAIISELQKEGYIVKVKPAQFKNIWMGILGFQYLVQFLSSIDDGRSIECEATPHLRHEEADIKGTIKKFEERYMNIFKGLYPESKLRFSDMVRIEITPTHLIPKSHC